MVDVLGLSSVEEATLGGEITVETSARARPERIQSESAGSALSKNVAAASRLRSYKFSAAGLH